MTSAPARLSTREANAASISLRSPVSSSVARATSLTTGRPQSSRREQHVASSGKPITQTASLAWVMAMTAHGTSATRQGTRAQAAARPGADILELLRARDQAILIASVPPILAPDFCEARPSPDCIESIADSKSGSGDGVSVRLGPAAPLVLPHADHTVPGGHGRSVGPARRGEAP